ncbi:cytochrome D1 domain-containing protein [Undibacterium sp. JH2W]|uniref:YVTN family beta-propeller repeat protein n=1 Tax=Undibacterium sp. JH2W TaxID=3413037 RepID=UPI003BEF8908
MKKSSYLLAAAAMGLFLPSAQALPPAQDRVYTADQNSNTVSVFNPATNTLVGQIRLGNARPDVLSPLYKGQINVHGLGFSPDHKTLLAISNGSNAVSFIDTATNKVNGTTYVGRSPHEGFFSADGKEVWVVVRGEDYVSVIDPISFKETRRIQTGLGPGMVQFHPDGKLAFVASSFTAAVDVVDVKSHEVIKKIPVVSPFSPFLQFTPDGREVWMTHKDVGKVTRIDTRTLEVIGVFDTGFITNHIAFAKVGGRVVAYVSIGGENVVKVYSTDKNAELMATIATGALPHGIWASDDSSRVYVGLENGDGVEVIDTASNKVLAHMGGGQAPQALVYLSHVVESDDGSANLLARGNGEPSNIRLQPAKGDARGFVVLRNLGVVDALEVSLFKLKPGTTYSVYVNGQASVSGIFRTDAKGAVNGTMIGPVRELVTPDGKSAGTINHIVVMEGCTPVDKANAVLVDAI